MESGTEVGSFVTGTIDSPPPPPPGISELLKTVCHVRSLFSGNSWAVNKLQSINSNGGEC